MSNLSNSNNNNNKREKKKKLFDIVDNLRQVLLCLSIKDFKTQERHGWSDIQTQ